MIDDNVLSDAEKAEVTAILTKCSNDEDGKALIMD
jgi:hypothetical protein